MLVIDLGAVPYTQYASYPTPINTLQRRIPKSKQSPFYHLAVFVGLGITDGNIWGGSNYSYAMK